MLDEKLANGMLQNKDNLVDDADDLLGGDLSAQMDDFEMSNKEELERMKSLNVSKVEFSSSSVYSKKSNVMASVDTTEKIGGLDLSNE